MYLALNLWGIYKMGFSKGQTWRLYEGEISYWSLFCSWNRLLIYDAYISFIFGSNA
jgi:hypothetical protein